MFWTIPTRIERPSKIVLRSSRVRKCALPKVLATPRIYVRIRRLRSQENCKVNRILFNLHVRLKELMSTDEGQDLVEYALVVALIAFGASAAMKGLSTEIKTAFNAISSDLATSL